MLQAGNGGNGEILTEVKSKRVKNFKYNPGGSSVRVSGLMQSRTNDFVGFVVKMCAIGFAYHTHLAMLTFVR